ncbi:transposase domain-containing protein [Streptomyces sp. NPDC021080]|uniref:transposase domain-containing protein n=1 Tax=Streptomyces sp. NPDC021080 TaxID=3365110 RepID=UPI0037ABD418
MCPRGLVDRVVAACGRAGQRQRLLPEPLVVYFVLKPPLFSPAPYPEVTRHLVEGLRSLVPSKAAVYPDRRTHGR